MVRSLPNLKHKPWEVKLECFEVQIKMTSNRTQPQNNESGIKYQNIKSGSFQQPLIGSYSNFKLQLR